MEKNHIVLVVICTSLKMTFVSPLRYKSQVTDTISNLIRHIRSVYSKDLTEKLVFEMRHDNEPVMASRALSRILQTLRLADDPIVPHNS